MTGGGAPNVTPVYPVLFYVFGSRTDYTINLTAVAVGLPAVTHDAGQRSGSKTRRGPPVVVCGVASTVWNPDPIVGSCEDHPRGGCFEGAFR